MKPVLLLIALSIPGMQAYAAGNADKDCNRFHMTGVIYVSGVDSTAQQVVTTDRTNKD